MIQGQVSGSLEDMTTKVLLGADRELIEIARRSEPSVLTQRTYDGMSVANWMPEVIAELSTRCPTVYQILARLLESSYRPERKNSAMCFIYGVISRFHELSRIQRINTVLLIQGQTSVNVSIVDYMHIIE